MTDLTALRDRVAGLSGADFEIDAMLHCVLAEDREWIDDKYTIYARNRKGPHDTYRVGFIDPGQYSRNFTPSSPFPRYTSSLDAALALVERVLPGTHYVLSVMDDGRFQTEFLRQDPDDGDWWWSADCPIGIAATLPLAIILALLQALSDQPKDSAS